MIQSSIVNLVLGALPGGSPSPLGVWLIPLLPVFGFLFQVFVGRHLPRFISGIVACGTVLVSAVLAWTVFLHVKGSHTPVVAELARWIWVPGLGTRGALAVIADHRLVVDQLTSVMILVITNIGFLIHLYSTGYMAEEKRYARYFAYLNLFTGFMLILVMGANLILMFVGWEGVGLCSYLLIGFWYEKKENAIAGMKAFIVNRVGDLAFTIGVLTLFVALGNSTGIWTVDFQALQAALAKHPEAISGGLATFIGICLFGGATGKSAQIPLYTWLPDAMAGPTPVSALIHAATMVTAGVYMIARMNFLFVLTPTAMAVVAGVGALTALFAGTIGIAQNDIKKVLAYSTVSQLGFMFMGVGVGAFAAGVFHLFTHAFFKACLFLGSGSVIHGMGGEQDIRKMGGLWKKMRWTALTFGVASIAIAGIPPFAGFFSKDEILWQCFSTHRFDGTWLKGWFGPLLWLTGAVSALCTAFYMARLVIKTFLGRPRWATASAFSGGGAGLPDWMAEEERKKKKEDEDAAAALPDDASLLDMGNIGDRVKGYGNASAPPPPVEPDSGHLPEDDSLLDLGKIGDRVKDHAAGDPHDAHDPHAGHADPAHGAHDAHPDDAGHGHGGGGHGHGGHHAGEPHESPASMLIPLFVLAAGSIVVGLLAVPPALGGDDAFGHWLEPVVGSVHEVAKHGEAPHHNPLEYVLMLVSIAVAVAGILGAVVIYLKKAGVPAQEYAARNPGLYDTVLNKYYVDEIYQRHVVNRLLDLNEGMGRFDNEVIDGAVNAAGRVSATFSRGAGYFDNEVVDAAVNAAAEATQAAGRKVRRLQTGNIKEYLTFALVGGLFVICFFCIVLTWDKIQGGLQRFFGG